MAPTLISVTLPLVFISVIPFSLVSAVPFASCSSSIIGLIEAGVIVILSESRLIAFDDNEARLASRSPKTSSSFFSLSAKMEVYHQGPLKIKKRVGSRKD